MCATDARGAAERCVRDCVRAVHEVAIKAIHIISQMFKDTEVLSNFIRFLSNGIDLIGRVGMKPSWSEPMGASFNSVLTFLSAKAIVHKVDTLLSGEDAQKDVPKGEYNFLKVISKISFAISDVINAAKWLTKVRLLEEAWSKDSVSMPFWGASLQLTASVAQTSFSVVGFATNIASIVRKMVREHDSNVKLLLSLATEISRISAVILLQVPYASCSTFAVVAGSVGNITSLASFIRDEVMRKSPKI
jgi:hypothetical protein